MKYVEIVVVTALITLLGACAGTTEPKKTISVSPGQKFTGSYINVAAPNSNGWQLIQSSSSGMAFSKLGETAEETFGAQVQKFSLAPTTTLEELEALIKQSVDKDTNRSRFDVQQSYFSHTSERKYPCITHHSIVQDKAPIGVNGPLRLEAHGLYCRHPKQPETGFAIIYSHRGKEAYPNLLTEAVSFIQSVQVEGFETSAK